MMNDTFPLLIVLAGGESSRFWPLREKSLVEFLGKTLLELQLEMYVELGLQHVAVVCNPDNHAEIQNILGRFSQGIQSRTFVQAQPRGMGDALLSVEPILTDSESPVPAYICQVHDIFDQSLHKQLLRAHIENPRTAWIAAYEVEEYFPGGYLVVDKDLRIRTIVEKPPAGEEPSNLVNIVAHIHPDLRHLLDSIRSEYAEGRAHDDHYERAMARMMGSMRFMAVPYAGSWHPVKYPWHILAAMEYYLEKLEYRIADDAEIEDGVYISGPVYIEKGVRILHGADIRGPAYIGSNCLVGQYANIRESMISQNSIVGFGSEVNRSYIGKGAKLHAGKALDAVLADNVGIDEHVNLSAGMITANFRTDGGTVKSTVKGQAIDTHRRKLGAVIGAGAFIGVGALLMPGVKIGRNSVVGPLTLVLEDVPDGTLYYSEQKIVRKPIVQ